MLQQLTIQNYAIIDEIQINFTNGLTIITGETGAGKSILVGALGLILGERADISILMDKSRKCFIEGIFKTDQPEVKIFLKDHDLDVSEEIVLRREIATGGKSRAFINDSPVNLSQLKELTSRLVNLHQQFDSLELGEHDFQQEVIDALASTHSDLLKYVSYFKSYIGLKKELDHLMLTQQTANKELDYHSFLFNELAEANFEENEIEDSESKLKLINNAEGIKATLTSTYLELQESDHPMIQQIKSISNQLQSIADFHSGIPLLISRLHSTQVELQDIADEVDRLNNSVHFDTEKLNTLNERISTGYRLLKKHGLRTTSELILLKEELSLKLEQITNLETALSDKEKEVSETYKEAQQLSAKISLRRHKEIKPFEQKVNQLLAQVGMPNACLKVNIKPASSLNMAGSDEIEFLFDANKSGRFEPLSKVASGGELSRLMLIIKSLVARSVHLPTMIFDEIDSGISGEAARQVGIIMKSLSSEHQVISITHQPQIAARAETHFFVYKEIKSDRIATSIKKLDEDERITTIAIMLSGEKPTAAAFENAREMMRN